jgi:hypothetical protein
MCNFYSLTRGPQSIPAQAGAVVIRIALSEAAFEAIAQTLSADRVGDADRSINGSIPVAGARCPRSA